MPRNKEALVWKAYILDQSRLPDAPAEEGLSRVLQDLENTDWIIHTVIPNGINRWTIISHKEAE